MLSFAARTLAVVVLAGCNSVEGGHLRSTVAEREGAEQHAWLVCKVVAPLGPDVE